MTQATTKTRKARQGRPNAGKTSGKASSKPRPETSEAIIAGLRKVGGALGDQIVDAYHTLSAYQDQMSEGPLTFFWHLGQLHSKLREAEAHEAAKAGKAKCRHTGTNTLARALKVGGAKLKDAGYIYTAYPTVNALECLLTLRRADGTPLGFTALARLCQPSLASRREALLSRALSENWSEATIKSEIKAARGLVDDRAGMGGKTIQPPRSLATALARWERDADELVRYAAAVFTTDVLRDLLIADDMATTSPGRIAAARAKVERLAEAVQLELGMFDALSDAIAKRNQAAPELAIAVVDETVDEIEDEIEDETSLELSEPVIEDDKEEPQADRVSRLVRSARAQLVKSPHAASPA